MTRRDPSQLLAEARDGNLEALEALLMAVQPQLYRFSMKMCHHPQDAEDVLQESMMALARSFRDFRGASSFSTWLFTIVRSFCIKKRRKSVYAPEREESLESITPGDAGTLPSGGPDPHEQVEAAETWRLVHAAIRRIEPSYREILLLRDIEGLRASEVAQIVGISVPAVKSRLHRARGQLRDLLAATPYHPAPQCPDIRKTFSMYLEGDLSPDICAQMERHVENCPACAIECKGLRAALHACSTSSCEDVPPAVQSRVRDALKVSMHTLVSTEDVSS